MGALYIPGVPMGLWGSLRGPCTSLGFLWVLLGSYGSCGSVGFLMGALYIPGVPMGLWGSLWEFMGSLWLLWVCGVPMGCMNFWGSLWVLYISGVPIGPMGSLWAPVGFIGLWGDHTPLWVL